MNTREREELIKLIEQEPGKRRQNLKSLGIANQTYYQWRKNYRLMGIDGLKKSKMGTGKVWNRLSPAEKDRVIAVAKLNPELSARLIAVKITEEEDFSVSEPTVFRLLKAEGLITPRPLPQMPAAKEWRHKTTGPNQIWQCDGTRLFIVGWGYYNLLPVLDDYSRKVLAGPLRPQESGFSISDSVEIAIEQAKKEGHELKVKPYLYSDNGGGFISGVLNTYLDHHGIKHIYGTPYHPQGRGKIERFNRTIKEKICLVVHSSPDELQAAIDKAIGAYNNTPHESLKNVTPNDVYAGRQKEVLARRAEKKRLTIERRRLYNLGIIKDDPFKRL